MWELVGGLIIKVAKENILLVVCKVTIMDVCWTYVIWTWTENSVERLKTFKATDIHFS